ADYVIGRMREQSRILEPQERQDSYSLWNMNQRGLYKELAALHTIREPGELAERIRRLLREGVPEDDAGDVPLLVLYEAISLSPRISEAFVVELLELTPVVLAEWSRSDVTEPPHVPMKHRGLLERALLLAGVYGRSDLVKKLVDTFVELARSKPEEARLKLINGVARECLWSLKKLDMRDEIDRLLTMLHDEVHGGAT